MDESKNLSQLPHGQPRLGHGSPPLGKSREDAMALSGVVLRRWPDSDPCRSLIPTAGRKVIGMASESVIALHRNR